MKLFGRRQPAPVIERRAGPRTRVDCVATLLMPSGNRAGRLFDISTTGARFLTDEPPAQGVSALIEWPGHETYCRVSWVKPGMCGVEFDRPIPAQVIEQLAEAAPAGPRTPPATDTPGTSHHSPPPTRFVS